MRGSLLGLGTDIGQDLLVRNDFEGSLRVCRRFNSLAGRREWPVWAEAVRGKAAL